MNYLAHLLLSCDNEDLLLGNFMADFVSNKTVKTFPEGIQKGIELHRMIDSFTDNHEKVRKGSKRLRANHGKYAPVVIDILYDNILSKNWGTYHSDSLVNFSKEVYAIFEKRMDVFPPKLKSKVPLLIKDDFLLMYGKEEGLRFALSRMDMRTKFPSNFVLAADQLKEEYELFNEEFNLFFPEIIKRSKSFCNC